MGIASILPDEYFDLHRKRDLIAFLKKQPYPNDLKQRILTDWAKEMQYTPTEAERIEVGL